MVLYAKGAEIYGLLYKAGAPLSCVLENSQGRKLVFGPFSNPVCFADKPALEKALIVSTFVYPVVFEWYFSDFGSISNIVLIASSIFISGMGSCLVEDSVKEFHPEKVYLQNLPLNKKVEIILPFFAFYKLYVYWIKSS